MKPNILLLCGVALLTPIQAMAFTSSTDPIINFPSEPIAVVPGSGVVTLSSTIVSWTSWASSSYGSFSQNGNIINVIYTGMPVSLITGYPFPLLSSYTDETIKNGPTPENGVLYGFTGLPVFGGSQIVNNFHFSQSVLNPLINLYQVGISERNSAFDDIALNPDSVGINFLNGSYRILSPEDFGGGYLARNGDWINGVNGNGLIQLSGSYTDISFITSTAIGNNTFGATVGAHLSAVPLPAGVWLMLSGLMGVLGLNLNLRKSALAA